MEKIQVLLLRKQMLELRYPEAVRCESLRGKLFRKHGPLKEKLVFRNFYKSHFEEVYFKLPCGFKEKQLPDRKILSCQTMGKNPPG